MCCLWLLSTVLSNCDGNYMAREAQNVDTLALYRNSLWSPGLKAVAPGEGKIWWCGQLSVKVKCAFQTVLWSPRRMRVSCHTHFINEKSLSPLFLYTSGPCIIWTKSPTAFQSSTKPPTNQAPSTAAILNPGCTKELSGKKNFFFLNPSSLPCTWN